MKINTAFNIYVTKPQSSSFKSQPA